MGRKATPAELKAEDILDEVTGTFELKDHNGDTVLTINAIGLPKGGMEEHFDLFFRLPVALTHVTPGQVAQLLGVTPTAVRLWIEQGKLPARRYGGGHWQILKTDLKTFMEAAEISGPPANKRKKAKKRK